MAGYTYPAPPATLSGDTLSISRFLQNPTYLSRALRTLLQQRYIADSLLTGRYQVSGGSILYETGESLYTADNPRAVAPGADYPITSASTGTASLAKVVKWGQDVIVTDEAISRMQWNPVTRAMRKLANQNVKFVDSVALSAIASAVTNTAAAAATWSTATAAQIFNDVAQAKASIAALNQGYNPDTIVVSDATLAYATGKFLAAGYFGREDSGANPALGGSFPVVAGLRWLASPNLPVASTAFILDSTMLGGMADENLGGPGYVSAAGDAPGVEGKSFREESEDSWRLRCRRVTVPIVQEPASAYKITSV